MSESITKEIKGTIISDASGGTYTDIRMLFQVACAKAKSIILNALLASCKAHDEGL